MQHMHTAHAHAQPPVLLYDMASSSTWTTHARLAAATVSGEEH